MSNKNIDIFIYKTTIMRGYTMISDEEKNSILQQHSSFYNGYAVGNVPNEPQPLRVSKGASDPNGITVDNKGNVKTYQNYKINESVITEKKKEDKWIQDVDMDEGSFTKYCKGKVTCGCVNKALKGDNEKIRKQAQLYLNMNSDKCKSLQENTLKEFEVGDMDVSDEEAAYAFKSGGPEQFDPSYSDDSYGMDIDSIMNMFGDDISPVEYNDMEDIMNSEMDGKEKFHDEDDSDEFDGYFDNSEEGDPYDYMENGGFMDEEEQCEGCGSKMEEEISEIGTSKLVKGKKYRYKSPSEDDDVDYEGKHDMDNEIPIYHFTKGKKGYILNPKGVEDFINSIDDEEIVESVQKKRMKINEMFSRFSKFN